MELEQFKEKVLPLRGHVLSYAKRMLDNPADAEDVVQDVYLKLWYMRAGLDSYRSVEALVVEMTKNRCLNRIKERRREHETLDDLTLESAAPTPDRELEQKDDLARLMRVIDQLPELQQAVLRMKHVDGYEMDEIAAITGCTPEALRVNLSRARKKVKELFFKTERK